MSVGIKRGMISAMIGILVILAATGLFGWMIRNEVLDIKHMDLMAAGVLILGSGAAAMCCGKGEGRIGRTAAAEIALVLILGMMNLLLYDGILNRLLPCVLLIAGTAGAVLLTGHRKTAGSYGKGRHKKTAISKLNKKYRR